MDNDNIKQLLQNFLLNASIIVFKNVEFNPPTKEIYEIQEGESSAVRFQKKDFSRIVNSFEQKIIDLEDFKKLFDFIKTNIKYYASHLDTLQHIPFFLLIDFCKNHSMYINKNGKLSIDDLVNQLNNFLYCEYLDYIDLIPLLNFHSKTNEILLRKHIKIRRISNKEIFFIIIPKTVCFSTMRIMNML